MRAVIAEAANQPAGSGEISVGYAGPGEEIASTPALRPCVFNAGDLVIGGHDQHIHFVDLLKAARQRLIIHSTFLDARRFEALIGPIRAACIRGVTIDLLWGADRDDDTEERTAKQAEAIAKIARNDTDIRSQFKVHMRTTGSHAKFIFLDTEDGWLAAVGSCNWFRSPFRSVELSLVIRDTTLLADVATAIQRLLGRRGLADEIATEMGLTARDLRRIRSWHAQLLGKPAPSEASFSSIAGRVWARNRQNEARA